MVKLITSSAGRPRARGANLEPPHIWGKLQYWGGLKHLSNETSSIGTPRAPVVSAPTLRCQLLHAQNHQLPTP